MRNPNSSRRGRGSIARKSKKNTTEFLAKKALDPTWTRSGESSGEWQPERAQQAARVLQAAVRGFLARQKMRRQTRAVQNIQHMALLGLSMDEIRFIIMHG